MVSCSTNEIEKHQNNKRGNPNWIKGQSGNPNGRPKKMISLTSEMKAQLNEVCPYDAKGRTWLQYLVDRWLTQSVENATYFRELIERLEGKITQPIGGEGGQPIKMEIVVRSENTKKLLEEIAKGVEPHGE